MGTDNSDDCIGRVPAVIRDIPQHAHFDRLAAWSEDAFGHLWWLAERQWVSAKDEGGQWRWLVEEVWRQPARRPEEMTLHSTLYRHSVCKTTA